MEEGVFRADSFLRFNPLLDAADAAADDGPGGATAANAGGA